MLTPAEQVQTIARAIGKEMRVEGLSGAEARQAMLDQGADPAIADSSVTYWSTLVDNPEPVTTTVTQLIGRPAWSFAQWAHDHADEFRILSTTEVADRYIHALSTGRVDEALAKSSPPPHRTPDII